MHDILAENQPTAGLSSLYMRMSKYEYQYGMGKTETELQSAKSIHANQL